jgi:hypothetical protein
MKNCIDGGACANDAADSIKVISITAARRLEYSRRFIGDLL